VSNFQDTMHFHGLPERLLGSRSRIAVLSVLLGSPSTQWTGREVARKAGVSPTQALTALRAFEAEGVCWQRRIGRASVWSVDPDHFVTKALASVVNLDQAARRRLEETIAAALKGSGAVEAYLFGSVAAGREEAGSDIDLLVVFPDGQRERAWRPELDRLRTAVQGQFSSFLSPSIYTRAQARKPGPMRILREARRTGSALEVGG
jgi:predicted nucleotidyltransferase